MGAVLLPKPLCVKIYLHYCILNSSFSQSMEDNSLFYTGKWLRKKHWLGGWIEACGACASQAKGEVGGMLLLHAYSDIVIDTLKGLQLFFVLISGVFGPCSKLAQTCSFCSSYHMHFVRCVAERRNPWAGAVAVPQSKADRRHVSTRVPTLMCQIGTFVF